MEYVISTWSFRPTIENIFRMKRFDGYLAGALKWKSRDGINPVDCPHDELIKIWNKYIPERAIDTQSGHLADLHTKTWKLFGMERLTKASGERFSTWIPASGSYLNQVYFLV